MTSLEICSMISMTAQPPMTVGALTPSWLWLAVCGNHEPQWQPFLHYRLILLGLGKREEKRRTVPARQQIEVSY
jgi:hypothetical protein